MQVGKNKDQGLYNKPSAAVHPEALAAGTLAQYNTIQYNTCIFVAGMRKITKIISHYSSQKLGIEQRACLSIVWRA